MTVTKDNLFKPTKLNSETKAAVTNAAARGIIEQEADARDRKTRKLKALRLAREAAEPAPAAQKRSKS